MRRVSAVAVIVVMCLCVAGNQALATDPVCKPVIANYGVLNYVEAPSCDFQGVAYPFCAWARISGNLVGTWFFYFPSLDNFVEVTDPMPGHPGFAAGWGVGTYETPRGELWTRDTWVADAADFPTFAFVTQTQFIVGGTGAYENATGHLALLGDDFGGVLRGEVCTVK